MDPNLPLDPTTGMPLVPPPMPGGPMGGPPMGPPMGTMPPPEMAPPIDLQTREPTKEPPPPDPLEMMVELLMNGSTEEVTAFINSMEEPEQLQLRRVIEDELEEKDPARAKFILSLLPEHQSGAKLPKWWTATYGKD